ncbi:LacI family DNA-binding transcriptional regulator [Aliiglaciecola sp. 2_MG-2023]|uniref:LacI family DNA-binding transcriptional regulator n=1 Tax=unclassified Aliiglaciecola TaxID=2593648 RepID=UPI0026E44599|nr:MULTISPECIES: LacI family DNA-binding transcriptional regulator [unclassified Aliiglaciecola]MDO6710152.1 LacI family DNA-binding transcriptional regulator [Aliiglaciecola sp. 2_MG-2023]MDO6751300.1 LacI family DNA-binding transcriptional regulator [Aliiglaciecola sp. 1_MG-2023]
MSSIKDVAAKANVSIKTVSRVLSGFAGVSSKTKEKVESAMQELEFYPSAAAQSLRGRDKGIVCLITEKLTTTPDSFDIIAGIQSECEKQGKLLMIGESGGSDESFSRLVDDFRRQRAEAIIFATVYRRQVKIKQSFKKCPLILVNCFEANLSHPTILPNDYLGAYQITDELIAKKHRKIAYLTLFEDMPATQLRLDGYRKAHEAANLDVDRGLIQVGVCRDSEDEFSNLPEVLQTLLSRQEPPTAICCGNDKMAMRVYMLIRKLGFQIPESISIVGYDNYKLIAENLLPKLTTVSLPYFSMGQRAAQLAINKQQVTTPEIIEISGELVLRDSHGYATS